MTQITLTIKTADAFLIQLVEAFGHVAMQKSDAEVKMRKRQSSQEEGKNVRASESRP